jgi:acyl-CoA thioesterase
VRKRALRAMTAENAQAAQRVLALTVHFNAPVQPGAAVVRVRRDRPGGSVSSLAATLSQDNDSAVTAFASFGRTRTGPELDDTPPPDVPDAARCPPLIVRPEIRARFPLAGRFERRRLPAPNAGSWIRFAAPRPLDPLGVVALLDSWTAAAAAKITVSRMLTVVYFVQFLRPLPSPQPDDFVLVRVCCDSAEGGYADDQGELWSGGTLIARSQQVVLIAT